MNIYCVSFFHYNECFHLVLWVVDVSFCGNELGGYELLGILCGHKRNEETIIFNIDLSNNRGAVPTTQGETHVSLCT